MNSFVEEFKHAFKRPDNGLMKIIVINTVIFLGLWILEVPFALAKRPDLHLFIVSLLSIPSDLGEFITRPWTLFTYFFTHTGFFHFLFNMLFLYWFGRLIVEYLGNRKLVSLYVLGGLAGGILFLLIYNLVPYFADRVALSTMLGASAGVLAIVVGAATLMPNYTFVLLLIGPVKIKYIAIFQVFMSYVNMAGANAGGEIAHLGGALVGFLFIKQLQGGTDWGTPVWAVIDYFDGLFTRKSKIKVSHSNRGSSRSAYNSNTGKTININPRTDQNEIDAILDKISESGYESLSKEEKQKLFNASKK